jgi:serine/threonine protein kinase
MSAVDEPRVLGPYVLLAPLAHGGMGSVFVAADAHADRDGSRPLCLVKTLKVGVAEEFDNRDRFVDEAKVALTLRHENLCRVMGSGNDGGEFYLAMELIEGVTFKRLAALLHAAKRRLADNEVMCLAVGLLRGLHAAHTAVDDNGRPLGIVHRDVSPHNVMVDVHGRTKIIDFGLATSVLKETFTESAVVLGKSAYMAPEQSRGDEATPAADQYAAAIVMYELLTGDRFYGELTNRAIWNVVAAGGHRPRAWHEVPGPFAAALVRALSVKPQDRFPDCAAFADALEQAYPQPTDVHAVAKALGAFVRSQKPKELDIIDQARMTLLSWDDTGRMNLRHDTLVDITARNDVMERSGSAGRKVRVPDVETSVTALVRPTAESVPRRFRTSFPTILLALGLLILGVPIAVMAYLDHAAKQEHEKDLAAQAEAAEQQRLIEEAQAARVQAANAEAARLALEAERAAAALEVKEPIKPVTPAKLSTAGLRQRVKKLKSCTQPCVSIVAQVAEDKWSEPSFTKRLSTCEALCD